MESDGCQNKSPTHADNPATRVKSLAVRGQPPVEQDAAATIATGAGYSPIQALAAGASAHVVGKKQGKQAWA